MAQTAAKPDTHALFLSRTFAAPRPRVFRAWTEPEALKEWWVPAPGFRVPAVEVDLRAGGTYRIYMENPKGERFAVAGSYREVSPPERLVYTWHWEGTQHDDIGETLVTVEFAERGSSTEVRITHELFPNPAIRDRHGQGWGGCLDSLTGLLQAG